MTFSNPWTSRFQATQSDEELRRRLRFPAVPINDLASRDPDQAMIHLRHVFKEIVVPTGQVVAAVRRLIRSSHAYCELAFASSQPILRRMYDPESFISYEGGQAICLTGLAGVGKSVILQCFARLHSGCSHVDIEGHARLELKPYWRLHIHDRVSLTRLLASHFRDPEANDGFKYTPVRAVHETTAQGIAILLADEFQFITHSNANVMMSKLLLQLTQIGPPLVYACNYSMVRRLMARPQQERDRLLLDPIVIRPEPIGPDWTALITEMFRAAPEFSGLNATVIGDVLHSYCFGILRSLRRLLELAYIEMRNREATAVDRSDIEHAYLSPAYSAMRSDVENLRAGAINRSNLPHEFQCPFGDPIAPRADLVRHPAVDAHAERAAQEALKSVLSAQHKETLELLKESGSEKRKCRRDTQRPPANAENLLGGAERFARGLRKDDR